MLYLFRGYSDLIVAQNLDSFFLSYSLFQIKITLSVTKNSHKDCVIYTYLFFSFIYTILFCGKIGCCDRCFLQQIRPLFKYILQDYSSVRIGFNKNNTPHATYSIHHDSLNT